MKRVIAISLLLIFVAGQVNLTWASHYCMSFKVKSAVMLGQGNLDCGMGNMMDCNEDENECGQSDFEASSCCSNDYITSDSDDFFEKENSDFNTQYLFVVAFTEILFSFSAENDQYITLITPSPPLIHPDRQIVYQSFLL